MSIWDNRQWRDDRKQGKRDVDNGPQPDMRQPLNYQTDPAVQFFRGHFSMLGVLQRKSNLLVADSWLDTASGKIM